MNRIHLQTKTSHALRGAVFVATAALIFASPLTAAGADDAPPILAAERMNTHVGDSQPIDFREIRPFPEPVAAAEASPSKSYKSLYWIGAVGAAMAAAYFIFSEEPESVRTELAID